MLDYLGASSAWVNLTTGEASFAALGDVFTGIENLGGSNTNDRLTGDAFANALFGRGGLDILSGEGGNDILYGDALNDVLRGGSGVDILHGGTGADTFAFLATTDSGAAGAARDRIRDFSRFEADRIDVSAIDANSALLGNQAFAFRGALAFTGAGQVRTQVVDGNTLVLGNTDANPLTAEFSVLLIGALSLAGSDFVL
jgi:Ca2+-binding RTX toxin-like protein